MRTVTARCLCFSALMLGVVVQGRAQDRPATAAPTDPRIGLEAGLRDAGQAARNMELVSSLPKPEASSTPRRRPDHPRGLNAIPKHRTRMKRSRLQVSRRELPGSSSGRV